MFRFPFGLVREESVTEACSRGSLALSFQKTDGKNKAKIDTCSLELHASS